MPYVIQRPDGAYRTPPGNAERYSPGLRHAQIWTIKAIAEYECTTADETVVHIARTTSTPSGRPRRPLTAEHIQWMRDELREIDARVCPTISCEQTHRRGLGARPPITQ